MTDNIAVLIPCYNEAHTIDKVVRDFKQVLPQAVIYVYDNNSTDNSAELARKAGAIVRSEKRQGKGNVLRQMFKDIKADCYLLVDADDTYPASAALQLVTPILNNEADMVVGDRLSSTYFTENKRPFHGFGNTLVCLLVNMLFSSKTKDVLTGYRALSSRFIKDFQFRSHYFEFEVEISIHAIIKKMRVKNVAVSYRDRPQNSYSKLNTIKDGIIVLMMIIKMYFSHHFLKDKA